MLIQEVGYENDPEAAIQMVIMENEIYYSTYKVSIDPVIYLTHADKIEHKNVWRTYIERTSRLEKQQGQTFSVFRGHCIQVLL